MIPIGTASDADGAVRTPVPDENAGHRARRGRPDQFSDGFVSFSITITSTCALVASNFSPNCC